MIKAILFDMDGVLIDAKDWHYEALNQSLANFGFCISRESHLSTFDGLPTFKKLEILSKTRGLPLGLHKIINDLKQQYTLSISYQRCKPTFNHQYALRNLKRDGYKIAVCSNSVRKTIEAMMQLSHLSDDIDFIISNQEVTTGKPDPEMYLKAMDNFQLSPNECLILEDNEHGIQAAISSGAHLLRIGVPGDVTYEAIKQRIFQIEQK